MVIMPKRLPGVERCLLQSRQGDVSLTNLSSSRGCFDADGPSLCHWITDGIARRTPVLRSTSISYLAACEVGHLHVQAGENLDTSSATQKNHGGVCLLSVVGCDSGSGDSCRSLTDAVDQRVHRTQRASCYFANVTPLLHYCNLSYP